MEDFEYSVEICDRDWDCFFAECEECNLLPPSLAGVDDSGMSDIDDTGSILAKRVQKVELTAGFSEAELPIDGPPDCEGCPVEHYLSKHTVLGMESMLSGSEEDIHLQSVNMFIEKLKNVTEADSLTEPSQWKDGKNSEAMQEDERCSDGQQASGISLPKNIPKLNTLSASGETAVGKETTEPVDTISNIMKKDVLGFNISLEPAASNVVFKTNKSAYPESRLFIREETCTETRVNEATQLNHSNDSLEGVVSSETTPQTEKVIPEEMRSPLENIEQEDLSTSQLTLSKICITDSSSNLEMGTHVERNPNPDVLQSDAAHRNKAANQESSPSASIKRKRRKKRRLSVEPAESVHGYERKLLVKQSDSEEEEEYVFRGGTVLCFSADIHLSDINDLPNNDISSVSAYTATSNIPVKISAKDISQHQYLLESIVQKGRSKPAGSTERDANNNGSTNSWSQTDDSSMSASINSGNLATHLQLCSKLRVEESTRLPASVIDAMTGKSETANRGGKDTHAESLQQLDNMSQSIICCENERNPDSYSTKVKSICILPSAESNDPAVEASQSDKLSAAKLVLAVEAGNSGRDTHTVCQREAEPQQQLEIDCQDIDQYRSRLEKPAFPLPASSSDSHDTKCNQLKTGVGALLEEISNPVGCAKLTLDTRTVLPERDCVATSPCRLDINSTAQQTEYHLVLQTSKLNVLSEKSITNERIEFASSQIMAFQSESSFLCGENNLMGKSQRGNKSSLSEDLLTSPSDITPVSSYCSLDTESVESLSNENIAGNRSNCDNQGEKTWPILAKHEEGGDTSVSYDTTDSKCDSVIYAEDIITASKTEFEPEKETDAKCSVFAMSSFWRDMEKLTINDILGLRMISKAAPLTSHPPLQENEEAGMFAMTDSGFFNQLDESKSEQTNDDMASNPNSVESSSDSVQAVYASTSRGVMWEGPGADSYPGNMTMTSVSDISQSVLSGAAETHLRKISKNVSMHNLLSLECESSRYTREGQTLQSLDEGEEEYFTDEDKDVDSIAPYSPDSYRISLTDIFHYLFSRKQSIPSQSATDSKIACCNDGNSVSEMYDHFFSEFDTESFFYPLITAEDETKNDLVPIFSCSRSSNRNLQFPEAYDHFFASSSSDDSSVESDEEDGCGPVRVVTRFSHASSASEISPDTYENFFTDSDLRQNFFWKTTFSFRNFSLSGSTGQKRTLSNPLPVSVPVRQSGSSSGRTVHPINPQDMTFPDPLLGLQSLGYKDLQTPLPNPRTDASLLPLRQSDMCLVCIAFASWVLKTANPQVGDTWKAVLLANVSALSAIRYLRKYVKMEVATNQKKMNYTTPSES